MTGGYKHIVFSDDLLKLKDFKEAKSAITKYNFNKKLKRTKKYIEDYIKVPEGTKQSYGLNTKERIEYDIASMLYGPRYVPPDKIIDPFYKQGNPMRTSKVASDQPFDRPRKSTVEDLGTTEEALKATGHPDEIKKLKARDPLPTDPKEYQEYVKRLTESDSPYERELAEELKLTWMKEHPELPFPDDWIPKGKK